MHKIFNCLKYCLIGIEIRSYLIFMFILFSPVKNEKVALLKVNRLENWFLFFQTQILFWACWLCYHCSSNRLLNHFQFLLIDFWFTNVVNTTSIQTSMSVGLTTCFRALSRRRDWESSNNMRSAPTNKVSSWSSIIRPWRKVVMALILESSLILYKAF